MKSHAFRGLAPACLLFFAPAFSAPPDSLSLDDALRRGDDDPAVRAAGREVRAAEALAAEAGRLENPRLSLEAENFAGTGPLAGADALETTVRLDQSLELGGKRRLRRAHAEAERALATAEREARRTRTALEIRRAFYDLLWRQERSRLAAAKAEVLEDALRSAARRTAAGGGSVGEEGRIRLELSLARLEAAREDAARVDAKGLLAARLGLEPDAFAGAEGSLENRAALPELPSSGSPDLSSDVWDRHPEVTRWRAERAARAALRDAARAERVPTLDVNAGVRRQRDPSGGHYAFVGGVSLPLPVWNRNAGAVRSGGLRVDAARTEEESARRALRARAQGLLAALIARDAELRELRERVLPQAHAVAEAVRAAHAAGRLGTLERLDAERLLFETQERRLDALIADRRDRAELESIFGAATTDARETP